MFTFFVEIELIEEGLKERIELKSSHLFLLNSVKIIVCLIFFIWFNTINTTPYTHTHTHTHTHTYV